MKPQNMSDGYRFIVRDRVLLIRDEAPQPLLLLLLLLPPPLTAGCTVSRQARLFLATAVMIID